MERSFLYSRRCYYFVWMLVLLVHLVLMLLRQLESTHGPAIQTSANSSDQKRILDQKVLEYLRDRQQIVDSEDAEDDSRAIDSRFLSDKNRHFDRQSRAHHTSSFNKSAQAQARIIFKRIRRNDRKMVRPIHLNDLGAFAKSYDPYKASSKNSQRSVEGAKNGDPLANTKSSSSDYVPDVPSGDFTHLNTHEYKFYGFYKRVKDKIEQYWHLGIKEKAGEMRRVGRRLPASEVLTSLSVTLDERGEILAIKVTSPSGIREMDDAAIESFNKAGPFPNPPKELIIDGKVTLEWGFVVKS